MWVYDVESSRFRAVNDAAIADYGYSREEFLGMTILDIRSPDEARTVRASSEPHPGCTSEVGPMVAPT